MLDFKFSMFGRMNYFLINTKHCQIPCLTLVIIFPDTIHFLVVFCVICKGRDVFNVCEIERQHRTNRSITQKPHSTTVCSRDLKTNFKRNHKCLILKIFAWSHMSCRQGVPKYSRTYRHIVRG